MRSTSVVSQKTVLPQVARDAHEEACFGCRGAMKTREQPCSANFVDELENQTADRLAYFFSQEDGDPRNNNALAVLRSIEQQNLVINHVRGKWNVAGRSLSQDKSSWVALRETFTKILMDIKPRKVFFVIVALDHLTRSLSDLLKVIAQSSSPNVK